MVSTHSAQNKLVFVLATMYPNLQLNDPYIHLCVCADDRKNLGLGKNVYIETLGFIVGVCFSPPFPPRLDGFSWKIGEKEITRYKKTPS